MSLLLLVSIIWAFSFGLIGTTLHALHPGVVSLVRLALAAVVFAPFARRVPYAIAGRFALIGAIQFGVMYTAYNWSFQFLKGHEVALLTVTTPFFVTALHDLRRRAFSRRNALLATAAVGGALLVIDGGGETSSHLSVIGIVLTQLSNLAFALGQLAYRHAFTQVEKQIPITDAGLFFYSFTGAVLVTIPFAVRPLTTTLPLLTYPHLLALLYLGTIASGLSFFLWNRGARFTTAGMLAVMNNVKIPLAVTVSLLVFHEPTDVGRLLVGGTLVVAAAVASHTWSTKRKTSDILS